MIKKTILLLSLIAITLSVGCTQRTITPVTVSEGLNHVCIKKNTRVIVPGFLSILESGFDRHGITTDVYMNKKPEACEYIVTYTALQTWDVIPYLAHAEIRIKKDRELIAYGEYHLIGGGGIALTKYAGVKNKMDPVIDEMLGKNKLPEIQTVQSEDMKKLETLYKAGAISEEEYKDMKTKISAKSKE